MPTKRSINGFTWIVTWQDDEGNQVAYCYTEAEADELIAHLKRMS